MSERENICFSESQKLFREQRLPVPARPAGYAALIEYFDLRVPLPCRLVAIGEKHRIFRQENWQILSPRHAPSPTLEGHLTFALKHEGLDLAVLKKLFQAVGAADIRDLVLAKPTGSYARRIWFLYEWLMEERLDLPDAPAGSYVDIVNVKQQYAVKGPTIRRQRVRNNLPGTVAFCPLVFRTGKLEEYVDMKLSDKANDIIEHVPRDLVARTAAFLLLKDSRSSFDIEGESPAHDRVQRWGRAIHEAGQHGLDLQELLRLQKIIIGDARFIDLGLRKKGGFVGEHDRRTQEPLPDHISARHEDLDSLLEGMMAFAKGAARGLDAVIAAAVLSFAFVYIHPFEDGNGRLHRYLIHHILARRGFNPPGLVFPVSAAILERLGEYKEVLESYSARLLPLIEWEPTEEGNVQVLNETADYYRYFDATPHAVFLYQCVRKTIEKDLPEEIRFLRGFDHFAAKVEEVVADMPHRTINLLFNFLHQNEGRLSKRARTKEFAALGDDEVDRVEQLYAEAFCQEEQ